MKLSNAISMLESAGIMVTSMDSHHVRCATGPGKMLVMVLDDTGKDVTGIYSARGDGRLTVGWKSLTQFIRYHQSLKVESHGAGTEATQ